MSSTVTISLTALLLTALAIIFVNPYAAPNDYAEPVLQIPMLVLLGLFGVAVILLASEKEPPRGYWLLPATAIVSVVAFILGTARIG